MTRVAAASIIIALLVVTGSAAAAHTVVVASHTTEAEFDTATELTNVTTDTSGSVVLQPDEGTTATRGADTSTQSESDKAGLEIIPKTDLTGVNLTISSSTSGATTAYVTYENGTVIGSDSISGGVANITADLDDDTVYHVVVDAGGGSYTAGYDDNPSFPYETADVNITQTVNGGAKDTLSAFTIRSVKAVVDHGDPGTYISANYSATDINGGFTDLSLSNTDAIVTWQGSNGATWTDVSTTTYSTSGNKSVSFTGSYDTYRVNVTFTATGASPSAELLGDGIEATTSTPAFANATASPSSGEKVSSGTVELSVDVSDGDFGTGSDYNDSVTVEFFVNGSSVGTDTLTANGTATYDYTVTTGGARTWSATATDQFSNSQDSAVFDWRAPGTLYIRNVSNASQLVDSPTNVTVQFVGTDQVIERTTTDGTVSLSGIPIDQEIVVTASAAGYHDRTILINDIFQQDSVYLLNQSIASNEVRFVLDDVTGEYTAESDLILVRPVTENGTTEFKTVVADQFGVEGVTTHLADGQRYRVKIRDSDDNVQDLGPFRSDVAETVTVRPGAPTIQFQNYTEEYAANATLDNTTLEFAYSDPDGETTSLTVFVHERGNVSNQLTPNRTYSNLGNVSGTYTLTSNQSDDDWVVNFIVERGGEEFTLERVVSNNPNLVPPLSREWRLVAGIGLLLISAGVFSLLNAGVGGVIVAIEGGVLWWTGFLEGATTGIAVVIALFVAVLFHVYRSRAV